MSVYANCKHAIAIAAKIAHDGLSTIAPDVDPEPEAVVAALPIVEEAVVALAAPTAGVWLAAGCTLVPFEAETNSL
jgi:hypothetical protein